MKAAGWQPVSVARSCKKYIALWEAHHLPEVILTAADQNVLAGVHDDAAQEEERALWIDEGKQFPIVKSLNISDYAIWARQAHQVFTQNSQEQINFANIILKLVLDNS